jgi:hypothetical protein
MVVWGAHLLSFTSLLFIYLILHILSWCSQHNYYYSSIYPSSLRLYTLVYMHMCITLKCSKVSEWLNQVFKYGHNTTKWICAHCNESALNKEKQYEHLIVNGRVLVQCRYFLKHWILKQTHSIIYELSKQMSLVCWRCFTAKCKCTELLDYTDTMVWNRDTCNVV